MSTLADLRAELAVTVAAAMRGRPVYAWWPSNVSAPCAVIELGAGKQEKRGRWGADWRVTVIGPAGDNEAAAEWVEAMTLQLALAVSERFTAAVSWDRPATSEYAGTAYLVAVLTVRLSIEPDPIPS